MAKRETSEQILARWEREAMERRANLAADMAAKREAILTALRSAGVGTVLVSYSGSGDSGQIDEVQGFAEPTQYNPPDNDVPEEASWAPYASKIDLMPLPSPFIGHKANLLEVIEDFCNDWVETTHGGYENDDGGQGTMTIDVERGKLYLHHEENFIQTNSYDHQLPEEPEEVSDDQQQ